MKEVFKDIAGYEGLYQVSNLGRVKSLPRKRTINKERILKPKLNKNGYLEVALCKNSQYKMWRVHKLVANAFISNPENKSQINHINGRKEDNRAENLEYCTASENIKHAWDKGLICMSLEQKNRLGRLNKNKPALNRKKVNQYDLQGNFIKEWDCILNIEKNLNIKVQNICACCSGKKYHKTAGGYIWKYKDAS